MSSPARRQWQREVLDAHQQRQKAKANARTPGTYITFDNAPAPAPAPPPEPKPVPTFSECVIGYRVWNVDALGRLRPQSVDRGPWVPGVNTAECHANHISGSWLNKLGDHRHRVPDGACTCGLYARFDLDHLPQYKGIDTAQIATPVAIGSVAAWGNIEVHCNGMRAEKACVTALGITDDMPSIVVDLMQRVAINYRVPAVPLSLLPAEAMRHGSPLPHDARPAPSPGLSSDFQRLAHQLLAQQRSVRSWGVQP